MPRAILRADVLVARGLIAEGIRVLRPRAHLVEISAVGEVVTAIFDAVHLYGEVPLAVYGPQQIVNPVSSMAGVDGLDIGVFPNTGLDKFTIRKDLTAIVAAGRKVVVCGPVTYFVASGVPGCVPVLVKLGRDSVRTALTVAVHTAAQERCKQEKAAQFQALLDCSSEGIVVTDLEGSITIFNAAASALLEISPVAAIGSDIASIIPSCAMTASFREAEFINKEVVFRGMRLSVNKARVTIAGRPHGHVLALRPGTECAKHESGIHRQVLYN